jgi:hypothetical protein
MLNVVVVDILHRHGYNPVLRHPAPDLTRVSRPGSLADSRRQSHNQTTRSLTYNKQASYHVQVKPTERFDDLRAIDHTDRVNDSHQVLGAATK